ncbi:MAG TPA: SDR family NAD(P)-dependent oxidoreductase [Solirubrobacteraceae bacterium]|nr:SDR family NAD(P)-dependent oxidoreductase [Solirubrobacteraceae bacterium]
MGRQERATIARVLITGSTDGLGRESARQLVAGGHEVVLHGRSEQRADEGLVATLGAADAVVGDLASIDQTVALAGQVRALGRLDVVIHNAGIGYGEPSRVETEDGLEHVFQINVLAPYLLTALVPAPRRLIYLSSGLHRDGDANLDDLQWERRRWDGYQAYCDSKLFDTVLAAAVARRWPAVTTTSLEPGWVKTKLGGADAPGDVKSGAGAEGWLATSDDPRVRSGQHFDGRSPAAAHPAVADVAIQDGLLAACERVSGVGLA